MKLKKVTSLALAAIMATSLIGCSKPADSNTSTKTSTATSS